METSTKTITKRDLIERIVETTGATRSSVKVIVQSFLDEVIKEVGAGHRLEFRDFGVFEVRHRAAREAQNPKTMEKVSVSAKRTVKFKAGRKMKDALDGNDTGSAALPDDPQGDDAGTGAMLEVKPPRGKKPARRPGKSSKASARR